MNAIAWDPPTWPAVVVGVALLVIWLANAWPSRAAPTRGALRIAAALLLTLALLDVGCRGRTGAGEPRLIVLLDRSLSMEVGDPDGPTRAAAARALLDSEAFGTWSEGWEVAIDSFGGATTDPGAAVAAAAAGLPGAILLLSDGRASAGRVVEPPEVPLWAVAPGPETLEDAAVLGLEVRTADSGADRAVVEVGAVGGRDIGEGLELVVTIDGREVGREPVEPLPAGEAVLLRIPVPEGEGEEVVEARLEPSRDGVPENDRRSLVRTAHAAPSRALVVGLSPGWEMGPWRRGVEGAHPGPVDAFWSATPGALRPVDGGAGRPWSALDPGRYRTVHLIGDPGVLGVAGRTWMAAFAGRGGRGVLWMPEGGGGRLAGTGVAVERGSRSAAPLLTEAGRSWLAVRGVEAAGPDGGPGWPPLERLPESPAAVERATVLLEAGGAPAAWVEDRGTIRSAVLLGVGWYRWPIETGPPRGPAPRFWDGWTTAVVRWLAAASPAERPLARLPVHGRVARGRSLEAAIAAGVEGGLRWSVADSAGAVVDSGELAAPASGETIRVDPLPPGVYRLTAETDEGAREGRRFVVETWAPDLARTDADTAALAAASRASGGRFLVGLPEGRLEAPEKPGADPVERAGPVRGLGTRPWAYLAAAILLLADWGLGARALARPERPG